MVVLSARVHLYVRGFERRDGGPFAAWSVALRLDRLPGPRHRGPGTRQDLLHEAERHGGHMVRRDLLRPGFLGHNEIRVQFEDEDRLFVLGIPTPVR